MTALTIILCICLTSCSTSNPNHIVSITDITEQNLTLIASAGYSLITEVQGSILVTDGTKLVRINSETGNAVCSSSNFSIAQPNISYQGLQMLLYQSRFAVVVVKFQQQTTMEEGYLIRIIDLSSCSVTFQDSYFNTSIDIYGLKEGYWMMSIEAAAEVSINRAYIRNGKLFLDKLQFLSQKLQGETIVINNPQKDELSVLNKSTFRMDVYCELVKFQRTLKSPIIENSSQTGYPFLSMLQGQSLVHIKSDGSDLQNQEIGGYSIEHDFLYSKLVVNTTSEIRLKKVSQNYFLWFNLKTATLVEVLEDHMQEVAHISAESVNGSSCAIADIGMINGGDPENVQIVYISRCPGNQDVLVMIGDISAYIQQQASHTDPEEQIPEWTGTLVSYVNLYELEQSLATTLKIGELNCINYHCYQCASECRVCVDDDASSCSQCPWGSELSLSGQCSMSPYFFWILAILSTPQLERVIAGLDELTYLFDDFMLYDFHSAQYLSTTQNAFQTLRRAALLRYFPSYIHEDSSEVIFENPNSQTAVQKSPQKFLYANRGAPFFLANAERMVVWGSIITVVVYPIFTLILLSYQKSINRKQLQLQNSFAYWPLMLSLLLERNVQYSSFLFWMEIRMPSFGNPYQKFSLLFCMVFYFVVLLYGLCVYSVYKSLFSGNVYIWRLVCKGTEPSLRSLIYLTAVVGVRPMSSGLIHMVLTTDYTSGMLLVLVLHSVVFLLMSIFFFDVFPSAGVGFCSAFYLFVKVLFDFSVFWGQTGEIELMGIKIQVVQTVLLFFLLFWVLTKVCLIFYKSLQNGAQDSETDSSKQENPISKKKGQKSTSLFDASAGINSDKISLTSIKKIISQDSLAIHEEDNKKQKIVQRKRDTSKRKGKNGRNGSKQSKKIKTAQKFIESNILVPLKSASNIKQNGDQHLSEEAQNKKYGSNSVRPEVDQQNHMNSSRIEKPKTLRMALKFKLNKSNTKVEDEINKR